MATLREHILTIKEFVEKHPEALDMEVWGTVGSSGAAYELSNPSISKVDNRSECGPWSDSFPKGYKFDTYVDFYLGN